VPIPHVAAKIAYGSTEPLGDGRAVVFQKLSFNVRVAKNARLAPHHVVLGRWEAHAFELHFRWIPLTQAFAAKNAGLSRLRLQEEHVLEAPPSCDELS